MFNEDNEIELLRASVKGDATAFETIIRKYQSLVCAITFSATGNVETSEELAQEAFISAWNGLGQLKDLRKFRSWLSTIARNVIKNSFRRKKRDIISKAVPIDATDCASSLEPEPAEVAITEQRQAIVAEALEQIPEKYRESLVLFYRQEQSVSEVAQQLELSEGAVRQRLSRGRVMLKKQVAAMVESTISMTGPGKAFSVAVAGAIAALATKGATASAAVTATSTSVTGISTATSVTAVWGTITAKIVTAMVVIAISIGSVAAYKTSKNDNTAEKKQLQVSAITQQEAISNNNPAAPEIASSKKTVFTVQEQEIVEDETAIAVEENITEKNTKDIKSAESLSDAGNGMEIVDRDNHLEGVLGLKVVTKETGEAIKGAQVKVRTYGDDNKNSKGKTDEFGRINIELGEEELTSLSVAVTVKGRVPTKVSYRDEIAISVPLNYTLVLEKGTSIGGIIKNEQKEPVQGASVSLLVPGNSDGDQPSIRASIWDHVVKTDEKGKWRCDIMPSELDDIWIRLAHPDYIDDTSYGATEKPSMAQLRAMTGVMVLKKGLEVLGVVMDMESNPIANAFVAQGSDRNGTHFPSTRTDKQGKFRFTNVERGGIILTVTAKGMAPDLRPIQVRKGLGEIEFYLEAGYTVRGRVVDVNGNAISGAFAAADTWRGHRSLGWRVDTDAEGRFEWNEAPADEVLFDLGKSRYMSIRNVGLMPSDDEYELVMYRPLKVSGSVTDAKSGEPVESFKLISGVNFGNDNPISWSDRNVKTFTNGKYDKVFDEPRAGYALRVEVDGYLPSISRMFDAEEEEIVFDFSLEKGDGLSGVVYLPDGSPAEGADVALGTRGVNVENGKIDDKREQPFCQTGPDGRFTFAPQVEKFIIVAVHEQGWGNIRSDGFGESGEIVLEPWARIKGTVYLGKEPGAGETISMRRDYDSQKPRIFNSDDAVADQQGKFEFDRIIAGKLWISRRVMLGHNRSSGADTERVEVAPGETIEVKIGGKGRAVAGRLVEPVGNEGIIDWKVGWISISTEWNPIAPKPTYPDGFAALSKDQQREWISQWYQSEELDEYRELIEALNEERRSYPVIINEDGSFKADGLEAGRYRFSGNFNEPSNDEFGDNGKAVGAIEFEFDVPEMEGEFSSEVLDLGYIEAEVFIDVEIGGLAPDFEVKDVDGKVIRLSDYRGRFVLIDQWSRTSREDARDGLEEMGRLYEMFGANQRFVMFSVTNSTPPELMKQYMEHYGMEWVVGLFQEYKSMQKALRGYALEDYPGRFLVGPEGRLLGRNLKGQKLIAAIRKALSQ